MFLKVTHEENNNKINKKFHNVLECNTFRVSRVSHKKFKYFLKVTHEDNNSR